MDFESIIISTIYQHGGGINAKQLLKATGLAKKHENKIKEVIKKLIEFTSSYEKKEVLEFNNTKWL